MDVKQIIKHLYEIEPINDPYSVLRMLGEHREGVDIDAVYDRLGLLTTVTAVPKGKMSD